MKAIAEPNDRSQPLYYTLTSNTLKGTGSSKQKLKIAGAAGQPQRGPGVGAAGEA